MPNAILKLLQATMRHSAVVDYLEILYVFSELFSEVMGDFFKQ